MHLTRPSSAAFTSLIYITIGALMDVWSGIWWYYMDRGGHPPENVALWYVCYGFLLTGAVLIVIGFAVGRIGRSARKAEVPTQVMAPAAANGQPAPAANLPAAPAVPVAQVAVTPAGYATGRRV
jgi:hypothetical protein